MAALSPWVWFAGYAGLVALTFAFPNPILILVLLFGGLESWQRFKTRKTPEARAYHAIPTRTRVLVAVVYLGLAALLAVGVAETFLEKSLRRRLGRLSSTVRPGVPAQSVDLGRSKIARSSKRVASCLPAHPAWWLELQPGMDACFRVAIPMDRTRRSPA